MEGLTKPCSYWCNFSSPDTNRAIQSDQKGRMMARQEVLSTPSGWPDLPLSDWVDTCATLHLWTQVVGKIRLAHASMINHWWQVPLYVTCRGLTTSPIPYGSQSFQIDFDFIDHLLKLQTSKGDIETMGLGPRAVADFYMELMGRLRGLGLETRIWTMPVEIPDDQNLGQHIRYA